MSDRNIGFFHDIPVEVVVELGRARMTIRELAALERVGDHDDHNDH